MTTDCNQTVETAEARPGSVQRMVSPLVVTQIPSKEAEPWLLARHYAKRLCPISYAFGVFRPCNQFEIR